MITQEATPRQPALEAIHEAMRREGTVVLDFGENPLDENEWRRLDQLTSRNAIPYERVTLGDADEPNFVEVGRFMTDVEAPALVNRPVSDELMSIIGSPKMMKLYSQALGVDDLYIRRCQVNFYNQGSFVGLHLDTDSNPDYLSPVVLQFSGDYEGGDYVVHLEKLGPQRYRTGRYSLLISRCDLPHEVTQVTRGTRKSLVFFLSRHMGKNRRWEQATPFQTARDMGGEVESYWKDRWETDGLELLYSDGKGHALPGTFKRLISDLQEQMPGYNAEQYFENQPTIFRDYDHLVVARTSEQGKAVGLAGARWFGDEDFSFLYLWTAMISEQLRGRHLVRNLLAFLVEKAAQAHDAPLLIATKTYSPVAFRAFMSGMRLVPGVEGIYPDLTSDTQRPELVEQARRMTRLLCPKLEVDYERAVVRDGQTGVAPDFFPERMPLSGDAQVDDHFQRHLTRRDQILMFATLPQGVHTVLSMLRALGGTR
jgi:hypothetical protein